MNEQEKASRSAGRKVLMLFVGAFGIIIGVNMLLLYFALGSWPGLETKNAYADSLGFQERADAQAALNWVAKVSYEQGDLVITLKDGNQQDVPLQELTVRAGRATYDREDRDVAMESYAGSYRGTTDMPAGNWQVRIFAKGQFGEEFRQIIPLIVR